MITKKRKSPRALAQTHRSIAPQPKPDHVALLANCVAAKIQSLGDSAAACFNRVFTEHPETPDERIARARAAYERELNRDRPKPLIGVSLSFTPNPNFAQELTQQIMERVAADSRRRLK